jgi:holliday junction DNA helicase RuvA
MIARLSGTLVGKQIDLVEILTPGGVGYAVHIPLSTYETLPDEGGSITLLTELVVREDAWPLYGFATELERTVFRRLLTAKGFGAALALGMLSTMSAEHVVDAIRRKDVATLQRVPRVGRKKAEQLILDLADKLDAVVTVAGANAATAGKPAAVSSDDAVRAVTALGYGPDDAMRVVRIAREQGGAAATTADIIRRALALLA